MLSRRCKSFHGQSLASSPVAELVGRRRRRSEAGGSTSTRCVLSLESCLKVVVPYGINRDKNACSYQSEPRTVSSGWNAESAYAYMVRHGGGHRGRRPDHADQGITRELGRASSASCPHRRGSMRSKHFVGVHRDIKAPATERPAAPPGRSFT